MIEMTMPSSGTDKTFYLVMFGPVAVVTAPKGLSPKQTFVTLDNVFGTLEPKQVQ